MAKLTIYQRLGKLFGPAGPSAPEPTYQKFKVGTQDILKTDSKSEYEERKVANTTIVIPIQPMAENR